MFKVGLICRVSSALWRDLTHVDEWAARVINRELMIQAAWDELERLRDNIADVVGCGQQEACDDDTGEHRQHAE